MLIFVSISIFFFSLPYFISLFLLLLSNSLLFFSSYTNFHIRTCLTLFDISLSHLPLTPTISAFLDTHILFLSSCSQIHLIHTISIFFHYVFPYVSICFLSTILLSSMAPVSPHISILSNVLSLHYSLISEYPFLPCLICPNRRQLIRLRNFFNQILLWFFFGRVFFDVGNGVNLI